MTLREKCKLGYLSTARVEYSPPDKKRRVDNRRAKLCLTLHEAGCGCWRSGPVRASNVKLR